MSSGGLVSLQNAGVADHTLKAPLSARESLDFLTAFLPAPDPSPGKGRRGGNPRKNLTFTMGDAICSFLFGFMLF